MTRSSCRASAIPPRAAYVFGAERFSLSPQVLKACEFVVKIPTRFSINVGMAGAIVLYDRLITLGGYGARPVDGGRAGRRGAAAAHMGCAAWQSPAIKRRLVRTALVKASRAKIGCLPSRAAAC